MTTPTAERHTQRPHRAPESFAARVRTSTAQRHSQAEHSTFMTDLTGGSLDATAYRHLLAQYQHIYEALEIEVEHHRAHPDPVTAPFLTPGLDRLSAIRSDLAHIDDGAGLTENALPATVRYVERIRATRTAPERFLAHHYLRYLGDLSGGQAVAALMARHYQLPPEALSMYRFPDVPRPKVFKDQYRDLLDATPLNARAREAFIDEVSLGFDLNSAVFAELDAMVART